MSKRLLIKIESQKILILEGIKSNNNIEILNHFTVDTPLNAVDDGIILDVNAVAKVIKNVLFTHKIRTKNVGYVLNTSSVITRVLRLPYVQNTKDALSMIKFELEQSMPIDLTKYHFIYNIVSTYDEENIKKAEYSVHGVENEIFDGYINLSEKLKLTPLFLDLNYKNLSYLNKNNVAINDKKITNEAVVGFINFNYKITTFSVLHNGINDFSRVIQGGYKSIEDSLIEKYHMNKDDILKFMNEFSLIKNNETNMSERLEIVMNNINSYVDELSRYIKYYNSKSKDMHIEKIYIYGLYSYIKDLDIYLSRTLGIDIVLIDSLSNLKISEKGTNIFDIREYFDNILGLYYTKDDINFLTEKNNKHKINISRFYIGLIAGIIIVLSICYFMFKYFYDVKLLNDEIQYMNTFLNSENNSNLFTETKKLENQIVTANKEIDKFVILNKTVNSLDVVEVELIKEIANLCPNDTTINSMSISNDTIQIQCESLNRNSAAQFLNNLSDIDYIKNTHIPSISQIDTDKSKFYSYVIICNIEEEKNDEDK